MKPIFLSQHAQDQMWKRGAMQVEVELAIREGEQRDAKKGRVAFRKNFTFQSTWKGTYYEAKQVMPIVAEEADRWVVVTVYVFYFGERS